LLLGSVAIGTLDDWVAGPVRVVSWHASPASLDKARHAPISEVPASYMQAQHLRGFRESAAHGLDYSRLICVARDIAGQCNIHAMTYVINSHLRRHDTYRSWFEYTDAEHIIRHTIADPADIEFVPTEHGEMTPAEFRDHILATPDPLHWDCFSFGVIQYDDHFTFYMSFDHLHMDAMVAAVIAMEFHLMYTTLVVGDAPIPLPPAGSYDDFCIREHRYASALTTASREVCEWIEFANNNEGTLPDFALPLGDLSATAASDLLTLQLMDEQETANFESACVAASARFVGGVFACVALTERQLTGAQTYYGVAPTDTRSTPADFMTLGWFTGLIPITVPVATASFGAAARAAQASFDSGSDMAKVPFGRVLELAPGLRPPRPASPVLNYFDAGVAPLSDVFTSSEGLNFGLYSDGRLSHQLLIWVIRLEKGTTVTVLFPNNPVAGQSITRYLEAMKSVCARVAKGRDTPMPLQNALG
jgi:hypothetical protein